jgi:hypothetical protein
LEILITECEQKIKRLKEKFSEADALIHPAREAKNEKVAENNDES